MYVYLCVCIICSMYVCAQHRLARESHAYMHADTRHLTAKNILLKMSLSGGGRYVRVPVYVCVRVYALYV